MHSLRAANSLGAPGSPSWLSPATQAAVFGWGDTGGAACSLLALQAVGWQQREAIGHFWEQQHGCTKWLSAMQRQPLQGEPESWLQSWTAAQAEGQDGEWTIDRGGTRRCTVSTPCQTAPSSSLQLQLPPGTSAVVWSIRMGKSQSLGLYHYFMQLSFPMDQ